jgi:hypothetical protein
MELQVIRQKIYEIRGQKVMLDFDLADLYGVETRILNQAVKRNIERFPEDFMFRLTEDEWMRSQFVTASQKKRNLGVTPYAFTEHGVSMLASVLRSEKAVQMSIAIVRAFIALKQYAVMNEGREQQIRMILERLDEHDVRLNGIYKAIENLLNEKAEKKAEEQKWKERKRIGFRS